MEIVFCSSKLKKTCENHKNLERSYGSVQVKEIIKRLNEFAAAETLEDIRNLPQARLHLLSGDLKGCFAVDLKHPYRMIINPANGQIADLKSITSIQICDIMDYH